MAVKKGGLRGLLNQNASDVLDSMQANSNLAAAEPVANGGGGETTHEPPITVPAPEPEPSATVEQPAPVAEVREAAPVQPASSDRVQQPAPPKRPTNRPVNRTPVPPVVEESVEEVEEEPRRAFFEELDRKEVRVYTDQLLAITSLRQSITRGKKKKGERITENTLIRTAIDLLLERQHEIDGVTENEIRQSLGLDPR